MRARALGTTLFGRRQRRAKDGDREQVLTIATALTVSRASATSVLFVLAIARHSYLLLLVALGLSMLVDFLDGFVARSKKKETILGAQLDGLADRLAALFVIIGVIKMRGGAETVAAATVVWLQFGIVDQLLTSQFLRFGLWSPDHFYAIDEKVWRRNWSSGAKLASNLPVAMLAVGSWLIWPALVLSAFLVVWRLPGYSLIRDQALTLEERNLAQIATEAGADSEREEDTSLVANQAPAIGPHVLARL